MIRRSQMLLFIVLGFSMSIFAQRASAQKSQRNMTIEGKVVGEVDTTDHLGKEPFRQMLTVRSAQGAEYTGTFKMSQLASISAGTVNENNYDDLMGRRVRVTIVDLKPDHFHGLENRGTLIRLVLLETLPKQSRGK